MADKPFQYFCDCCDHYIMVESPIFIGIVCPECNWEYDAEEQTNDPDAIGLNGLIVKEYRRAWIRAGMPRGKPRHLWPEEVN